MYNLKPRNLQKIIKQLIFNMLKTCYLTVQTFKNNLTIAKTWNTRVNIVTNVDPKI